MFVLQALESGEYSAFGSAIVTGDGSKLFSFEAVFEVQSTSVRFAASGSSVVLGPGAKNGFFFEVHPSDSSSVSFIYRDAFLPAVVGKGCWVKDCYLLTGQCKQTGASLTCHLEPGENQTLLAKAFILLNDNRRVALHFTLSPHEPQAAMANIVSIYGRRRA